MLFSGVALLQVTLSLSRRKALACGVATRPAGGFRIPPGTPRSATLPGCSVNLIRALFRAQWRDPGLLGLGLAALPALALLIRVLFGVRADPPSPHVRVAGRCLDALPNRCAQGLFTVEPRIEPLSPVAAHFLGSVQSAGWLVRLYDPRAPAEPGYCQAPPRRFRRDACADVQRTTAAIPSRRSRSRTAKITARLDAGTRLSATR